jgi:DNA-binding GntR family transcriptional regulator
MLSTMGVAGNGNEMELGGADANPSRVEPGSRDSTLVIHNELRRAILTGELAERSPVSQVRLAKRFGVSRGPVREALRLLEREGLIEAAVNQRARVAPLSIPDLEQLYAMRIVNEALGLRLSTPLLSNGDLDQIDSTLTRMDELAGVDIDQWETLHRHFHHALISHGGVRLVRGIDEMYDHSERYRRVYIVGDPRAWSVGAAEHRAIAKACRDREAELAATLLARHLSRTALTVIALMSPEHEPVTVRTGLRQVVDSS